MSNGRTILGEGNIQVAPQATGVPASTTPVLPLARCRLQFEALESVCLPDYPGSAWRGALGHALRKAVCVTGLSHCPHCLLYHSCPYPYVFETPPPPGARKMRRYPAAPHPFVIEPEEVTSGTLAAGAHLRLGLTVFGRGASYLPYLVHALEHAAAGGLGRGRGRLTLRLVEQELPPESGAWRRVFVPGGAFECAPAETLPCPGPAQQARIRMRTPLRLRHDGRNVRPDSFRFADLFSALLRRLSMLTYFHTDTPFETDFRSLTERAREVPVVQQRLSWRDWTRYSTRQRAAMQLGGMVGDVLVDLRGCEQLWPCLWLGQWTHAGHATSMGLGRFTLEVPE